ncbi:hypothetical protein ABT160_07265 [Streptomyces sp. NPDC001941]|uniref:hypothetical protein n=1 Tax=Streptomyces sp. NPDC001941 TaxID=3154659 RepID=UPI00331941D7
MFPARQTLGAAASAALIVLAAPGAASAAPHDVPDGAPAGNRAAARGALGDGGELANVAAPVHGDVKKPVDLDGTARQVSDAAGRVLDKAAADVPLVNKTNVGG